MMKNLLVEFLLIILSFHLTASSALNYQIVEIPQGSSSFSYEIIEPSSSGNYRTPVIIMKFSGDVEITFYYNEEDPFVAEAKDLNYLLALPVSTFTSIGWKSLELKFQNNNTESITMTFIDNSKEINISFENFINWKHDLKFFMLDDYSRPLPIIFNIDTIPEKVTYEFNTTIEGSISSEDELLYYCIKNGNECNYMPLNTLTFSEGKSYKIKLNPCTIYNQYFFFPPIQCTKTEPPKIDVQETQFGLKIIEIKSEEKKYYVLNTKSYNRLYIYTNLNYYYTFITEAQKNNLEDEIDNFIYEKGYEFEHLDYKVMDYLLIEIYSYRDYVGAIAIVNQVYEFYENYALQIKNNEYSLLEYNNGYGYENNIFVSSANNMLLISDLSYGLELTNKISGVRRYSRVYIFVDSLNHTSTITGFSFNNPYDDYKFNIVTGNELENAFKVLGSDYSFSRTSSHTKDFGFISEYLFDMNEKYYLYVKKYFGNVNFYSYNKQLDRKTNINEIVKPIPSYEVDDYKSINDKIIILSGYQFLTYYNSYGSLYDIFIQKVNDFETININQSMSRFNNLVKLLNKDKIYTLNFKVDHYIKLDKKTSDAVVTFIDKNGNEYYLNSNNRLLKSLRGENIRVKSDKNALVYFYKKIEDTSKIKIIEFNNTISQNLLIRFSNNNEFYSKLYIVKDFGYKECYPLTDEMNWDVLEDKMGILMIENLYDRLECDLDEDEKYIAYIFDSFDDNNLPTFHNESWQFYEMNINNSITKGNKYNFEILPPQLQNSIILYSENKPYITYQLIACENQEEITFNYENARSNIIRGETFNEYTNYMDEQLGYKEDLTHFIESDKEVLFAYHFHNPENYNQLSSTEYTIESVNSLDTNIIQIQFEPSSSSLTQYHIVISKKNEFNNKESFSNPCYIGKLMTHNSEDILVKTIFENSDSLLSINIDITPLAPKEKDILVIDVISNNMKSYDLLSFYEPVEYEYKLKEIIPLVLDKEVEFELNIEKVYKYDYKMDDMVVAQLVFTFNSQGYFYLLVTEGTNTEKIYRLNLEDSIYANLNKSATYYFQFIPAYSGEVGIQNIFIATLRKSELIESIDLSKKNYFNFEQITSEEKLLPKYYKVEDLKEDKNVLFIYKIRNEYGDNIDQNPFEICNLNTKECEKNIFLYKFIEGNDYIIYINYVGTSYYYENNYYYPAYIITPITENTIEIKEKGYHSYYEPKIFIVNLENQEELHGISLTSNKFVYSYTDNEITKDNINTLEFEEMKSIFLEILNLDKKKYIIIIPIDEILYDFEKKIVIVNQLFMEESNKYTIEPNKNAMIFFSYNQFRSDGQINYSEYISFYSILRTYSSPFNNMKFVISKASENINTNFILDNYFNFPIYIGQNEKNIDITVKRYEPRYTFFGAIDNNLFQNYLDYFKYSMLIDSEEIIQFNSIFPLVIRLNSDILPFNEYFNFYLSEKLKGKLKLYVRKIYGPAELYECDAEPLDKFDFSILTKPLSSCKNKRSLFNRLITFNETKIFSGYLDINSYFDIYIDLEEEENKDIKVSYAYNENGFKNTGKYLTKDKEYNLILEGEYMVKLESGFDAKVTIYDEDKTIILTLEPNKPSGRLEGQNLKIKSDNDAMVYFYGKLPEGVKQVKINNESGKNIIIENIPPESYCTIDIGFEGFSPLNPHDRYIRPKYSDGKLIYTYLIENIYDKLKIKLAEGESLYFYYYNSEYFNKENDEKEDERVDENEDEKYEDIYEEEEEIPSEELEIDYSFNNLNLPQNDYTFMVIPKTDEKKSNLIINNINKQYIRYQVNYCKNSLNDVKMHYYEVSFDGYSDDKATESEFVFSKEQTILDSEMQESSSDLRFESSDEFIFSYSFIDYTDLEFNDKEQWKKEREELKELKISEITRLGGATYSLKFKPNYKNSMTRYIIVIAEKDENNTEENFNNPCYITKLVTEKADGIKIINIYDNGEKEFISVDLELSDFLKLQSEYIISIISQEIRFEKKIHYYEATTFEFNLDSIEIEMGKEQEFNQEKIYFKLDAVKKSNLNEMFLINYNLEQQTPLKVKITRPDKQTELYDINKKEGFLNFLWDQSGIYMIYFQFVEAYYLKSNNNGIKGTFNILSTESAFNLDLTKDNIEFEEFSMKREEAPSLKFVVSSLNQDYIKKIAVQNTDFNDINKIVSVNKNNEGDKNLNFNYYTFEKDTKYTVTIKFNQKDNLYALEKVNIISFSTENIKDISKGNITYNDINDKFLIIEWNKISNNIAISNKDNNAKFFISELASKNLVKEFQNLNFKKLDDLNVTKHEKTDYSVLMVQLSKAKTEISFDYETKTEPHTDNKSDNKSFPTVYIVLISLGGLLVLIVAIFLIIRCVKRKQDIDFTKKAEEIKQEKLLSEL